MGSGCGSPLVCPLFVGVIQSLILPVRRDPFHGGCLCYEAHVSFSVEVGSYQFCVDRHQDPSILATVEQVLQLPVEHLARKAGHWLLQADVLLPLCSLWHVSMG